MKATVDLTALEKELETVFESVREQVHEIQTGKVKNDADTLTQIMATALILEGMGQVLRTLGHHIEEPAAKEQFLGLQRRFNGFKGAARGAMDNATAQFEKRIRKS